MEMRQLKKLKNDLLKFQSEFTKANNSDSLKDAVQIIIEVINKQIEGPTVAKKDGITSIISLLDSGDTAEIMMGFPRLNYVELEKAINLKKIEIETLDRYTIIQLKVIYYMLTHDKENNAIKTNKKESVLNSVKEAIFSNMRAQKLENI